jgi:hypothetical protein
VEQMWHAEDGQGQILVLAFRSKSIKPLQLFPLRSEAVIDSGLVGSTGFHSSHPQGGVPRAQKVLKGHPPRVVYHQVY